MSPSPWQHPGARAHRDQIAALVASTVSEFERLAHRLNLTPDQYVDSPELRAWAQKHKAWHYVPEALLQAWGMAGSAFLSHPNEHCKRLTPEQRKQRARRAGLASARARVRRSKNPS